MKKIEYLQCVFFLLIIFLPSNLFLILSSQGSFVNGLQVDYLLIKLYGSGLLVLGLVGYWLLGNLRKNRLGEVVGACKHWLIAKPWLTVFILILIARQFLTTQPASALAFGWQLLTTTLLIIFLQHHSLLIKKNSFTWAVFSSLFLQAILAIYQFFAQKPLLPYYILGESRFEPYFRLARHLFAGKERILSYGSTAHPNVLAGVSVVFFIILAHQIRVDDQKNKKNIFWQQLLLLVSLLLVGAILFTTQSFSASLVLLISSCYWLLQPKLSRALKKQTKKSITVLSLILICILSLIPILTNFKANQFPGEPSLTRRSQLNQAAWQMFQDHWLWGVGLNQFTLHLERYAQSREAVRFVQPAHHLGLLWLAESGIFGVGLLVIGFSLLNQKKQLEMLQGLLLISPLLVWDHYLYTLPAGQLSLGLYLSHLVIVSRR